VDRRPGRLNTALVAVPAGQRQRAAEQIACAVLKITDEKQGGADHPSRSMIPADRARRSSLSARAASFKGLPRAGRDEYLRTTGRACVRSLVLSSSTEPSEAAETTPVQANDARRWRGRLAFEISPTRVQLARNQRSLSQHDPQECAIDFERAVAFDEFELLEFL
jgi:hypothetical protein